jgi:hypothetical protein
VGKISAGQGHTAATVVRFGFFQRELSNVHGFVSPSPFLFTPSSFAS